MARAPAENLIGRTIGGKFVVDSVIGVGAMGAVYKAHQLALDKAVAVKVMHRDLAEDAQFAVRFQREAKAASRLDHPNSIRVIDFGRDDDGLVYLAMEFLDGRDLLKVITEDWPLSHARIVDVLSQVLSALAKAHELGIIHRDLKPENIMVLRDADDEGHPRDLVKVCDFGIAKVSDARAFSSSTSPGLQPLTTMGALVGTPEYMSPEQGRGEPLDARSDLYSVGVILFQMLTGTLPFTAENALGVVLKHVTDMPPLPSSLRPGIMVALERVCLKALRKGRDERYQSAREMRADLRAAIGIDVPSHPKGDAESLGDTVPLGTSVPRALVAPDARTEVQGRAVSDALAATQPFAAPATSSPVIHAERKETHTSTYVDVPIERSRVIPIVVGFLVLGFVGGLVGLLAFRNPTPPKSVASAAPLDSSSGGIVSLEDPLSPLAPASGAATARSSGLAHGAVPSAKGSARAPASASTVVGASSAAPTSTATASATAAAAASTAPPAQTAEPGPAFNPDRAYVEIGMVNPHGTKESVVRAAVRNAGLGACYKNAMRARGVRVEGSPSLSLSIDPSGHVTAVVVGMRDLPEAAQCFQRNVGAQQLPAGTFDAQGATAEVFLTLHPE